MKASRRKFSRALIFGAAAAPIARHAAAQEAIDPGSPEFVELHMRTLEAKISETRAREIREFLQRNTTREIRVLRAWPVRRDLPPALELGVFDD